MSIDIKNLHKKKTTMFGLGCKYGLLPIKHVETILRNSHDKKSPVIIFHIFQQQIQWCFYIIK